MEKIAPISIHDPSQPVDLGPAFSPLSGPEDVDALDATLHVDFTTSSGTQEEWNEAYARLSDYFRCLRIHSRLHRTYLVLETLKRATKTHANHPDKTPTHVAIHEARRKQRSWMRTIIGDLNISEGSMDANGRLAFMLCDGPRRWPHYFLSSENLPPDMVNGMRVRIEQSGPNLAVSSMVPRAIDLGLIPELTDDTMETFERHPILRYGMLLVFSALVIWGIWSVTR